MSKSLKSNKLRSISLPCRSHPSTCKTEEELNKLKTWESEASSPTAETIYNGLSGLEELYKCTDDLLNLPLTRKTLSHHLDEEWLDELLDGSVILLDICGSTRDVISEVKEHARDLQSILRRRKGDLSIESNIAKYISFRKKIKKDAKKLIAALKQVDDRNGNLQIFDLDHHLTSVIRVLREVNATSVSVIQSVLIFLSAPVLKPKVTKWSLVSKLMNKGTVACEGQQNIVNELEKVHAAIEGIENGLECMFRRLIRTRASLLNIVSY